MDVQLTRLRRKGVLSSDAADFDEVCQLMRAALSRVPLSFLERHLEEKNVTTILLRAPRASGGVPGAFRSTSGNYSNVELRGFQPADVIIDDEHDEVRAGFYCVTTRFEFSPRRQPAEPAIAPHFIKLPTFEMCKCPCMTSFVHSCDTPALLLGHWCSDCA